MPGRRGRRQEEASTGWVALEASFDAESLEFGVETELRDTPKNALRGDRGKMKPFKTTSPH